MHVSEFESLWKGSVLIKATECLFAGKRNCDTQRKARGDGGGGLFAHSFGGGHEAGVRGHK